MARARKEKQQKQRSKALWIVPIFMLLFIPAVVFQVVHQMGTLAQLRQEDTALKSQLAQEQERSVELENQKAYYSSDSYIEEVAREQLGLVKPDEVVFKEQE